MCIFNFVNLRLFREVLLGIFKYMFYQHIECKMGICNYLGSDHTQSKPECPVSSMLYTHIHKHREVISITCRKTHSYLFPY